MQLRENEKSALKGPDKFHLKLLRVTDFPLWQQKKKRRRLGAVCQRNFTHRKNTQFPVSFLCILPAETLCCLTGPDQSSLSTLSLCINKFM